MREIKFRGKCVATDKWLYGYLVEGRGVSAIVTDVMIYEQDFPWVKRMYQVDADTVGQFTGLIGKNVREICESDIATVRTRYGMDKGVVVFKDGAFMVYWDSGINFPRNGAIKNYYYLNGKNKVLGNIHENPELLGDEK